MSDRPQHEVTYLHVRAPRRVGVGGEGEPLAKISGNRAGLLHLREQVAVGAQFDDQNVAANDESLAFASNELSITQNQANAGLGEIDDLNQGGDFVGDLFFR